MSDSERPTAAFVLGNGPRLPVDDLDCLEGRLTIGVNRILRSGFVPTAILWVDQSVYDEDGDALDHCGALLVCNRQRAKRQGHIGLKTHVGRDALSHRSKPDVLNCNGNTGCCAARWAAALGCRPVYLVGMGGQYVGGQSNFYGDNPHHHRTPDDNGTLAQMRWEMRRLRNDLGDVIRHVPDGQTLREVANESPVRDWRAWLRGKIGPAAG